MKTNGKLEVEFQNQQGRQLRVTENRNPAAAPNGFVALEPVSYIVELGGGAAAAQGLTLSKIDYILNANSELRPLLFSTPSTFSRFILFRPLAIQYLPVPFFPTLLYPQPLPPLLSPPHPLFLTPPFLIPSHLPVTF